MKTFQVSFGLLLVVCICTTTTADNPSIRWQEENGVRSTLVDLAYSPGTFYIMNIYNMSDLTFENGSSRPMTLNDYKLASHEFGSLAIPKKWLAAPTSLMAFPKEYRNLNEGLAAHDRWYRRAMKRLNARKAILEFHMKDDMFK